MRGHKNVFKMKAAIFVDGSTRKTRVAEEMLNMSQQIRDQDSHLCCWISPKKHNLWRAWEKACLLSVFVKSCSIVADVLLQMQFHKNVDKKYVSGQLIQGYTNQGVFVKHYAPSGNKVQKAIFSFKVKVKFTRSLTLVSIERLSLVEYACQI